MLELTYIACSPAETLKTDVYDPHLGDGSEMVAGVVVIPRELKPGLLKHSVADVLGFVFSSTGK